MTGLFQNISEVVLPRVMIDAIGLLVILTFFLYLLQ